MRLNLLNQCIQFGALGRGPFLLFLRCGSVCIGHRLYFLVVFFQGKSGSSTSALGYCHRVGFVPFVGDLAEFDVELIANVF